MRKFLNPRLERGEVRIEDIELDHKLFSVTVVGYSDIAQRHRKISDIAQRH